MLHPIRNSALLRFAPFLAGEHGSLKHRRREKMDWKVAMERSIRVNRISEVNRRKICTERRVLFLTIFWVPWLLVVLMLGGCSCKTMYSNTTGGTIYIGQPQVLSRESVVPERQLELEWLRGQLAKTPNGTCQQLLDTH